MFVDVEYYQDNNASLTFHDLPPPRQNFEIRTALLPKQPWKRIFSQRNIQFST